MNLCVRATRICRPVNVLAYDTHFFFRLQSFFLIGYLISEFHM
jgi:hypothetical protein